MEQKQIMTNKLEGSIIQTLYKDQFRLKLGIVYLFCSGFNVLAIIIAYLLIGTYSLEKIIMMYLVAMLLYYKFGFKYTKDGGFYRVFLLKVFSDFKSRVNKALRKNLKENSSKKLG